MKDRLTKRSDSELEILGNHVAKDLTFNELIALAGQKLNKKAELVKDLEIQSITEAVEAGRDCSIAHTALEDALMRYNSASYRIEGHWKRLDPDS